MGRLAASALLVLIITVAPATAAAEAEARIVLSLPVACRMGSLCTIHKYVDHDPSPAWMDYACGRLSLDRDQGTDFRVPDLPAMRRGVAVLAAAGGRVKAVRDGMEDVNVRSIGAAAVQGREAGNAVVLEHDGGWETQYSHLRRGSVRVRIGDLVERGQPLGLIGMSGNAEFPHVEFSVRSAGRPVDPFVGAPGRFHCGDPRRPLWDAATLAQLPYRPSFLISAGFATDRPEAAAAREGALAADSLPGDAPALVFWVDVAGALAGDRQEFIIRDPDQHLVHQSETVLARSNVSWFAFSGRERPATGWKPGRYTGAYRLVRNGEAVVEASATVVIAR